MPTGTTRWLFWGLPGPDAPGQSQAGGEGESGLGSRHRSCLWWVCLPRHNGGKLIFVMGRPRGTKGLKKCHCHPTVQAGPEDLQQLCTGLASTDKLKMLRQPHRRWRSHSHSFWAKPQRERWERDAWCSNDSTSQKKTHSPFVNEQDSPVSVFVTVSLW